MSSMKARSVATRQKGDAEFVAAQLPRTNAEQLAQADKGRSAGRSALGAVAAGGAAARVKQDAL